MNTTTTDTGIDTGIDRAPSAPVPASLAQLHRAREADAFPVSWARTGDDHYAVVARWPDTHPYFVPVHGHRFDPLLVTETMRQATLLVLHAGYGVPLGHHFLLTELQFSCQSDRLAIEDGPAEVEVQVVCSELKWAQGHVSHLKVDMVVHRAGSAVATGSILGRIVGPETYRRIRGDRGVPGFEVPGTPPVTAGLVGRSNPEDVLLSSTPQDRLWQLRVDTGHPVLFQGEKDHVPGMLLLEAARQAAELATPSQPFVPSSRRMTFQRYAEFGTPCWIEADALATSRAGTTGITVTGSQDGSAVFRAELSADLPAC
ncbi:A-factor biosynthesis hotdog domain-containing protein [Streptomyces sp. TLI_053]|uniref:ScbA/BarX family gamma-butyrolactone biosynthesis protein n=1 Tax=Streptomyces sp. TLI_053 TaxID=1855352 RepID=UPI00087DE5CE|nr:ScbA/BarX family gamma-butyrolactone biosynthesis protein [Streptomyces sp. TLI_053]SDT83293.1 A-factor biosynthesis hotdog domain-containing protein [Streptomyces sp. TLI_053]